VKDGPFYEQYTMALAFLDALRKDDGERLHTSQAGIARPQAVVSNLVSPVTNCSTSPFQDSANGKDRTGF
jgi:hypothetical protein